MIRHTLPYSFSSTNTSTSTSHPHPGTPPAPAPAPSEPELASHAGDAPLVVTMQTMRWGLVPHFSKHEDAHGALKTINARSEALIEETRGMWASIKGRKRCAVVCQGCVRTLTFQLVQLGCLTCGLGSTRLTGHAGDAGTTSG